MRALYISVFIVSSLFLPAQTAPAQRIVTGTASIGLSAISISTIVAKTYKLLYPVYDYMADSAGNFFFSTRQRTEGGTQYLSKGFIGNLNMQGDSTEWVFESNYYEFFRPGTGLFISNELKTTRYNEQHGFVEFSYPERLQEILPGEEKALMYSHEKEVLSCVQTSDGVTSWTASLPAGENWVDVKKLDDARVLVAAAGLHCLSAANGLLWTFPLSTATRVTKALTYSLANRNALKKVSRVMKTSTDENNVTELSSNILQDGERIYFAARDKMIAVSLNGELQWELDLRPYPVSKMQLRKNGDRIKLVNFGIAQYADNYVIYGNPFVLNIDAGSGKLVSEVSLSAIDNLVDFKFSAGSLVFASKKNVMELKEGSDKADTLLSLNVNQYGSFAEFIDGDAYYTEKENFYIALNFINDNVIYFRADNNKIYSMDKSGISYSYHFPDIYRLESKLDNKIILANENKTLIVSRNFDLLATIDLADKPVVLGQRIFFVGDQVIYSLSTADVK